MTPVTVIILTKNEEEFITWCIDSVRWADEILVIDSESTDRTRELAESLGAKVVVQPWLGWAGQLTKAIALAKNDWILNLDADEIVTPELACSVQSAMSKPDPRDGYAVDRRGDFLGVLLPNESRRSRKLNFVRLFNRTQSAYDTAMKVHEEVRFPGEAHLLEGVLLHWRGSTLDELISVFNRYATVEAEVLDDAGKRATALDIIAWPILRFLWSYVVKGGFRLGTRGLMHSLLKATSDFMRYAKLWERQHGARQLHPPAHLYERPEQGETQRGEAHRGRYRPQQSEVQA